ATTSIAPAAAVSTPKIVALAGHSQARKKATSAPAMPTASGDTGASFPGQARQIAAARAAQKSTRPMYGGLRRGAFEALSSQWSRIDFQATPERSLRPEEAIQSTSRISA